jgi:hypothetical protein
MCTPNLIITHTAPSTKRAARASHSSSSTRQTAIHVCGVISSQTQIRLVNSASSRSTYHSTGGLSRLRSCCGLSISRQVTSTGALFGPFATRWASRGRCWQDAIWGGYILFHAAKYDAGRYRALLAIVARDFEPRRWAIEAILRHPGVSFNRMIPIFVRAPQDPPGHVDEVAWVYESGNPRTLREDLHFATCNCDSRPFLGELDVVRTPFYLLGGEYDWRCTEIHTGVMKRA